MNIVFMGTPDFAVPVLEQLIASPYQVALVVTQPDRPVGRKKILTPPPVKVIAEQAHIPVLQPEKVRKPEAVEAILAYKPDLIITCAFGQILPEALLNAPKYGAINVHASLLPEYRGAAPIHKAIMDGKKETGVTIMYMVKALDAGDILTQKKVPIEETDTVGSLHDKLSKAGAELLMSTLPDLIEGRITPIPQDESRATYVSTLSREDERIDWHQSGEAIYNHVRGMDPFPGAFTMYKNKPLKIWKTKKVEGKMDLPPGTILAKDAEGFTVQTGNQTAIKVLECQPAGKKRMAAADFLRGATLSEGDVIGE
ncbi:methionyl-tRNA formyltransferase [Tuberibacillus calidus]|mgnify:CR=1 FL=1|uniref:methionyl-tRNA formyltransferase n=1 Tax=Tuberibacillus calidus TaxID=340097 RepID=UPI00040A0902|nr:methionyl-tRNA formyltransferase [Tuberibacillus calidus]